MKSKTLLLTLLTFIIFIGSVSNTSAQTCTNLSGTISTQSQKTFCSGDGVADIVTVTVTGNRGTNYALLLTDANDKIQKIFTTTSFNVEGWASSVYNVRGISYEPGILNLQAGKALSQLSGCFAISNTGFTVTVFNKEAGMISTPGGRTDTAVCVNDGKPDIVPLKYTGLDAFGMMFILTNTSDIITSVNFNVPNLEGTGAGVVKLWIVTSCFETFTLSTGVPISSLGGVLDYSNAITITKNINCAPVTVCAPEVLACPGKVLMCINNVSTCVAQKDVSKKLKAGGKLGGCIRCTTSQPIVTRVKSTTLSIEDVPAIKIFPNPAKGDLNIVCGFQGKAEITIVDASGRIVYRQKTNLVQNAPFRINIAANKLATGLYTVSAKSATNYVMQKLVVQ
jgi:hypothetical protein